ncbi:MAG: RNB domain-containing ribonuclease, partial [Geobacter sp.]|nr:RNB domain-containing ribonuclease [Geobacter sp.]
AEMLFNADAELLSASFYPSVINSDARLTYTVVSRIVEHDEAEAKALYPELVADLLVMKELALALAEMRHARGSIDFDLPEAEILLAESGRPEAIVRAERNLAHKMIESFMLAANEAVAVRLAEDTPGALYRIHELPDQEKLSVIAEFFTRLGFPELAAAETVKPRDIQALLAHVEGKPEERLINRMLLRSMKQARYAAENLGHFGLAAPCYTHLTSPIRRYPDLIVHRILKWLLPHAQADERRGKRSGVPFPGYPAHLFDMGEHTSRRERVAMEAERDVVELMKIRFMEDKVGEEYDGFINGVSQFGMFVELDELFVEGLVHISTLPQDIYTYIDSEQTLVGGHSGARYRIGDAVRVKLAAVSRERRQIDFVLAGMQSAPQRPAEQYQHKPVKGKKPEGWGWGQKRGDAAASGKTGGKSPASGKRGRGR